MIDVIVFDSRGRKHGVAEAATPEDAVYAAGVMYGEARCYGRTLSTGFYVDGKLVRMIENRNPSAALPQEGTEPMTTAAPPVLSPAQQSALQTLCIGGRASAATLASHAGVRQATLSTLLRLGLVECRAAGAREVLYHLTSSGREAVFCQHDEDGLDDLSEEALADASSERPDPVARQTNRKGTPVSSTAARSTRSRSRKAAPAPEAAPTVEDVTGKPNESAPSIADLHKTLMGKVKEAARGVKTTRKAVYVRFNLGKETIAYLNDPGKKTVRLEVPKVEGGGYDAVGVKDDATMEAALALVKARVELVTAK